MTTRGLGLALFIHAAACTDARERLVTASALPWRPVLLLLPRSTLNPLRILYRLMAAKSKSPQDWQEKEKAKQAKILAGWDPDAEPKEEGAGSDSDDEELPFACYICRKPWEEVTQVKWFHFVYALPVNQELLQ